MEKQKQESWRMLEKRGAACRLKGDAAGCAQAYYEAARCDRFLRSQREHYSSYLFTLHYLPGISAEELARQHFVYGRLYRDELVEMEAGGREADDAATAGRRLRIGFLAPDFLESSAARFYEALLDLPQDDFEVFAYSLTDIADGFTRHIWLTAEHARVLPPHDIEASEHAIAADALDILVDLGGHTAGGATLMLLAHHPAHMIIEAVGWFDTTGLPTVDFLLTDDIMDPSGREHAVLDNFSESIRAQNKSDDNAINLQVGTKANQSIRVGLTDMRAEALGLQSSTGQTIQIGTQQQANAAVNVLDNAVQKALDQQTTIGSVQSRLSYTSSNLTTASENVQASESTIRDADMAKEMTEYTKNNVLLQAAQSMLAQANQSSSSVLSLLQ